MDEGLRKNGRTTSHEEGFQIARTLKYCLPAVAHLLMSRMLAPRLLRSRCQEMEARLLVANALLQLLELARGQIVIGP